MQKLLDGDANRVIKQRVGFKSAMLADVKPSADGRVQHRSVCVCVCARACLNQHSYVSLHLYLRVSLLEHQYYCLIPN